MVSSIVLRFRVKKTLTKSKAIVPRDFLKTSILPVLFTKYPLFRTIKTLTCFQIRIQSDTHQLVNEEYKVYSSKSVCIRVSEKSKAKRYPSKQAGLTDHIFSLISL